MPELPEVETIRRGLDATVRGARIDSVTVLWPPFVVAAREVLDSEVVGRRIRAIRRRGKALILDLGRDWHLLLHLKMTGQVVSTAADGSSCSADTRQPTSPDQCRMPGRGWCLP